MRALLINQSKERMPRSFINDWQMAVTRELKRQGLKFNPNLELAVVFLGPLEARKLNHRFRQKNYATDVLSFASESPESMGELVLCPEVIRRQALEHGLSFRAELAYMVLHGILHLLGYEHERGGAPAKRMFALQDLIFARLKRLHGAG